LPQETERHNRVKPSFHSAARELVDNLASLLPAEAASFTSASQAYEQAFVERCAVLPDDSREYFDVKEALRKLKGFRLRDFQTLRSAEIKRVLGSGGGKTNGHAAGIAWREMLLLNKQGAIKPLLANAITCLRLAPEWQGAIGFNELSGRLVKLSLPPFKTCLGDWTDEDDILTAEWLQHQGIEVGVTSAASAAQCVGHEKPFHPIRQYLSSLRWDGEKRLSRWLTTYLGVEWSEYTAAVGSKWLISAIARVQHPGCQVDTCLVLEGEQGIRKSSALRILAGDEWFTDQLSDLSNKDSSQDLNGKWIVEFSDLGQMSRAEAGVLKAFLSRRVDHYRQSYGRRTADFPRQCVFAASTNKDNWAGDETGGRRFWPVRCGEIDITALARDRDQLLAEALAEYSDGRHWWLEDEAVIKTAAKEQAERFETDPWDEKVIKWVEEQEAAFEVEEAATAALWHRPAFPYSVSTDAILAGPLGKPVGIWTGFEKTRVARILTFHGFTKFKKYFAYADGIPVKDEKTGEYITERRYRRK
jgi:hypothetical protein